jgi:phosphatidylserine/phosphatidylglycerophosphate/cardiolipin synthase-like enzyme
MLSFATSKLFDEKSFYQAFIGDLDKCEKEVVIESPFITSGRMKGFRSHFKKLLEREVKIYVFTRDPNEHEPSMKAQSEVEIANFERIGVQTFICKGNHHRKLAILDRKILWEGSLNILSQTNSREIMRRIEGEELAREMFEFLKFGKLL